MTVRAPSLAGPPRGPLARLGRWVVRHPWYPILFWVVLLVVTLPFLSLIGSVTTNSATSLPANSPSAIASQKIAELFPNESQGSSSLVLLVGPNITGPVGKSSTLALTSAIDTNTSLTYLAGVATFHTAYQGYLSGLTSLALGVIGPALEGPTPLPVVVNDTAQLLYGPPAVFLSTWEGLVDGHPGTPRSEWNYLAYNQTLATLGGNASRILVLDAFYSGAQGSGAGFNGSLDCANSVVGVNPPTTCAQTAIATQLPLIFTTLFPTASARALASTTLETLNVTSFGSVLLQRATGATYLQDQSGLPATWLTDVWDAFPSGSGSPGAIVNWTMTMVAQEPVSSYPLPVPASIQAQFIAPADDATILIVAFSVGDGYVDAHGNMPVFSDVAAINAIAPRVMATADPAGSITYYQTGEAALDATENTVLSASLSLLLPLTFGVLLAITVVYFRAPLAPLVTFGGLGIALVLGLGTIVLIGKLVTHVDVTALELETVFVLGVGTDYSIFLVARYREELYRGMEHREAVVTSVTWAGQSIATSGATATLATLALAFSGVALLSQWGIVLSASILLTLLIALTLVPAVLTLIGPRIFWPATGERFLRKVDQQHHRVQDERTYFYRTGRRTQRHPVAVTAIVLIASIPLVYVALNVPLAYDFYQQLPHGTSATDGLARLGDHFGPGFAFPMQVLVTFAAPLVVGNSTNASEFTDLATITQGMGALDHAASVASPVGSDGAALSTWLDFVHLPPATQEELRGTLHTFVGNDGRTVLCSVVASASGLSGTAVQLLQEIKSYLSGFAATHPDVTALAYGGGASVTNDLQQQTALATERMVLAVAIGLVVVLFVVLRSWIIPLLAVATIGLSIGWAWGTTGVVLGDLLGAPLFYFAPTILFILILGLGIDYNIFLLTRVREERLKGRSSSEAVVEAVGTTGGIITAAAIILASAFAVLATGSFLLLAVIGFAVATAIILDAMIVRTYLVPSVLQILGDRVWAPLRKRPTAATGPMDAMGAPAPEVPTSSSSGTAPEHV